jgi:argininosuccinate synthase
MPSFYITASLLRRLLVFAEREALQALVSETQRDVSGVVRLKLYKGNIIVAGRKSPTSLYNPKMATMETDASGYNQTDATVFICLNALRLKLRAALKAGGARPTIQSASTGFRLDAFSITMG